VKVALEQYLDLLSGSDDPKHLPPGSSTKTIQKTLRIVERDPTARLERLCARAAGTTLIKTSPNIVSRARFNV
jgi:hypothetical protein